MLDELVVLPETEAKALGTACGAVVMWELSGTLQESALTAAWTAAGLSTALLPELPSPEEALTRAVKELRGYEARAASKRGGEWALSPRGTAEDRGNEIALRVSLRAKLDDLGRPQFSPEGRAEGVAIRDSYYRSLGEWNATDMSGWLVRLAHHCGAVGLKSSGGVYFIPAQGMQEWSAICSVLTVVSRHRVHRIPAMRTSETVAAVLAAVSREAQETSEEMEEALVKEGVGERALRSKQAACESLEKKLSGYSELLGDSLPRVLEGLERTRAAVSAAILQRQLAAEQEEQKRAAP
jgi:hypothetical protein